MRKSFVFFIVAFMFSVLTGSAATHNVCHQTLRDHTVEYRDCMTGQFLYRAYDFPRPVNFSEFLQVAQTHRFMVEIEGVESFDHTSGRSNAYNSSYGYNSILTIPVTDNAKFADSNPSATMPGVAVDELQATVLQSGVFVAEPGTSAPYHLRIQLMAREEKVETSGFDSSQVQMVAGDVLRRAGVNVPYSLSSYGYGYGSGPLVQRHTETRRVKIGASLYVSDPTGRIVAVSQAWGGQRKVELRLSNTVGKYGATVDYFTVKDLIDELVANLLIPSPDNRILDSLHKQERHLENKDEMRGRLERIRKLESKTQDVPVH